MNQFSNRIECLAVKSTIGWWISLMAVLIVIAGAQNISAQSEPTIVGGQEVNPPFQYTWIAALINSTAPSGNVWEDQFCGGTLIQPLVVVTAAHCFFDNDDESITYGKQIKKAKDVDVLLGAHDLTDGTENPSRKRIEVSQLKIHENYEFPDNDIALLKLASPAQGLATAVLISKPSLRNPESLARAIGWGDTASSEDVVEYPEQLQQVNMPLVSQTTCDDAYRGGITDNMLCAGYAQGGKSICFGDSGGPLVVQNASQNNRWELIGISSFVGPPAGGIKCAQPEYPSVFVDVYDYLDWIKRNVFLGSPGVQLLLLGN